MNDSIRNFINRYRTSPNIITEIDYPDVIFENHSKLLVGTEYKHKITITFSCKYNDKNVIFIITTNKRKKSMDTELIKSYPDITPDQIEFLDYMAVIHALYIYPNSFIDTGEYEYD